jgi:hypothetical protein
MRFDFTSVRVFAERGYCRHMSITVELDLPDEILQQARSFGLLEGDSLAEILTDAVRRHGAGQKFKRMLDEIRSLPGEPMAMEEIQAEVDAVRKERREREAGR